MLNKSDAVERESRVKRSFQRSLYVNLHPDWHESVVANHNSSLRQEHGSIVVPCSIRCWLRHRTTVVESPVGCDRRLHPKDYQLRPRLQRHAFRRVSVFLMAALDCAQRVCPGPDVRQQVAVGSAAHTVVGTWKYCMRSQCRHAILHGMFPARKCRKHTSDCSV